MKVKYSLEIESELWSNKDEEHLIKVLNNDLPYLGHYSCRVKIIRVVDYTILDVQTEGRKNINHKEGLKWAD